MEDKLPNVPEPSVGRMISLSEVLADRPAIRPLQIQHGQSYPRNKRVNRGALGLGMLFGILIAGFLIWFYETNT